MEAAKTEYEASLASAQAEIESQKEAMEAAKTEYEENLAVAQEEIETQKQELEDVTAEYEYNMAEVESNLAEVEAYKLENDPEEGEAHLSTAVGSAIAVAADGVTASWQYTNSSLSGNPANVALELDGETLFSQKLQPGETLGEITLEKPLAAGTYQAMVVTTVDGDGGEQQMKTRVPVTLTVAAE